MSLKMNTSLKVKFLVPTVCVTIVCMTVISVVSYLKSSDAIEEAIDRQVAYVSASISGQIDTWIEEIVSFSADEKTGWIVASTANIEEIFAPVTSMRNTSIVIGLAGVAVIFVLIFLVTHAIVQPINRIIAGMEAGAGHVAATSGQVSSSSQSMAEGASQQASSIEESASSMEQIASMTEKNSESAGYADDYMTDVNQIVSDANTSMERLTDSMKNISDASRQTAHIIKTIDEIAFQTNLLALNAAVEAARAGEAGAGFAVVADEVRNLAIRAAEAANETEQLIDETVKKVENGTALVNSTHDVFSRVAQSAVKVGQLVAEISQASKEQSDGISQINHALSEMETVVQQNASSAEESAAAAEEMNALAEQLNTHVTDLTRIITGKTKTPALLPGVKPREPVTQAERLPEPQDRPLLASN